MSNTNDRIRKFFEDMATDAVEERVIEYVVREVHKGRRLMEAIEDPYVRNRLNDTKRAEMLENPEIVDALEAEIRETFANGLDFSS